MAHTKKLPCMCVVTMHKVLWASGVYKKRISKPKFRHAFDILTKPRHPDT